MYVSFAKVKTATSPASICFFYKMECSIAIVDLYMFGEYDLTELQFHRGTGDLQLDALLFHSQLSQYNLCEQ